MIIGLGVDIIEVERVRAVFERYGLKFVKKILGRRENKYFSEMYNNHSLQSRELLIAFLAKRFAAKEAIGKALGIGMRKPMQFKSVDIVNTALGKPTTIFYEDLFFYLRQKDFKIHLSISDEKKFAHAVAIIEN
ncbi:MAG: hypothetical protein CBC42_00610 [Betaproteobacteria bacterium TMED82]|nr:MAG: hypothetical protein CBC42_00610 [Betaproteobacteria bacterium TMED82]|tara:strand:+ start:25520 stop:25921 length:402 start_codon:yes stop_codon:yes gene_type:complete